MIDVLLGLSIAGFIIALGFFADLFFNKTKIPDVIWLMLFGIVIGPVLGIVNKVGLFGIAPLFTAIAIAIILFESGRKMRIRELMQEATEATVFMLANLIASASLVALGANFIFGMELGNALLLGVIVAGTSSPMITTIVDRLGVSSNVKNMMSVESVINSPFVIVVGLVLMNSLSASVDAFGLGYISTSLAKSFIVSITLGLLVGVGWAMILKNIESYKYHHMMTISVLFLAYALSQYLEGSGAMASLMMGITIGNAASFSKSLSKITGKEVVSLTKETKDFNALIAFVIRTFFFVFLGAIASLNDYRSIGIGLALTGLILAARFIVVYPTHKIMNLSRREMMTMGFMIPTGLSAAVLAVLSFTQYGIAGTENFVDIVFTIIIATTIFATVSVGIVEHIYNKGEVARDVKKAM